MSQVINLFSGVGWFLFGLAAVIAASFLDRMLRFVDRIISLAEIGAVNQVPAIVRKIIGK